MVCIPLIYLQITGSRLAFCPVQALSLSRFLINRFDRFNILFEHFIDALSDINAF